MGCEPEFGRLGTLAVSFCAGLQIRRFAVMSGISDFGVAAAPLLLAQRFNDVIQVELEFLLRHAKKAD